MDEPKQTPEQKKLQIVDELLCSTTRKRYRIPHISELVEALFDTWHDENLPPLKAFARTVKDEFTSAKRGSLQRTKLLEMHVKLLEMSTRMNVSNADDLSLMNSEDLMRVGREMWRDYFPIEKADDEGVGREPNGGGSPAAATEDPA